MPNMTNIQTKVLKLVGRNDINERAKLLIRKQFYVLKNEELELEEKVMNYENELDAILDNLVKSGAMVRQPQVQSEPAVTPEVVTPKVVMDEVIVRDASGSGPTRGVKVRMQEEINNDDVDSTDFEVPFEAESK